MTTATFVLALLCACDPGAMQATEQALQDRDPDRILSGDVATGADAVADRTPPGGGAPGYESALTGCLTPAGWTADTVASGAFDNEPGGQLIIDGSDGLHVMYGASSIQYAHKPAGSGVWTSEGISIDTGDASVAVLADGTVYIGYADAHTCRFLSRAPMQTVWTSQGVPTPPLTTSMNMCWEDMGPGGTVVYCDDYAFGLWPYECAIGSGDSVVRGIFDGVDVFWYQDSSWAPPLPLDQEVLLPLNPASGAGGNLLGCALGPPCTSGAATLDVSASGSLYALTKDGVAGALYAPLPAAFSVSTGDIKVDGNGVVHLAYVMDDASGYRIEYARHLSGMWTVETAVALTAGTPGQRVSLAVDSIGGAHLAYLDGSARVPMYGYRGPSAGSFVTGVIDPLIDTSAIELALDSTGSPHVLYNRAGQVEHAACAVSPQPAGVTCAADAQCLSGYCTDGVCCAQACTGGCEACSVAAGGQTDGACTPMASGSVCRAAGGACDIAETCDGVSGSCPADGLQMAGAVCRGAAGACDVAEVCDGISQSCPADIVRPADEVCRAAGGGCDVAEVCDGASAACPIDGLVAVGTICRARVGVCDEVEQCDGLSVLCPADNLRPAGTLCRSALGVCDVAESCDGLSVDCPDNAFADPTTECRAATGPCDVTEMCDGATRNCPADEFAAAGVECRTVAGGCDASESCDGLSVECPADEFAPAGTECRGVAGDCDVAESCDGLSGDCPADEFAAAGLPCRDAVGACDTAEACDGASASCPADASAPDGTMCEADACSGPDSCQAGVCVPGPDICEPDRPTPSSGCRASTPPSGENPGWPGLALLALLAVLWSRRRRAPVDLY